MILVNEGQIVALDIILLVGLKQKRVVPQGGTSSFDEKPAMYEFLEETVGHNMTQKVRTVAPETRVGDLYRLFAADDFDAYPVVRDDTLVGVVSKLDALKVFAFARDQLLPHYRDGMDRTVDEIMSTDVIAVDSETKLQRVLELMVKHRLKSLPVVDRSRNLLGIIAREDVMRAMERWTLRQDPPTVPFQAP